jgi:hypothetical protein
MAENKKVTLKQLMEAAAVLMRFLDEYQTVDKHNADAIVEYEAKVALIAIPLNIKKYERASSYSLVDLLQRKGRAKRADDQSRRRNQVRLAMSNTGNPRRAV